MAASLALFHGLAAPSGPLVCFTRHDTNAAEIMLGASDGYRVWRARISADELRAHVSVQASR